MTLGKAIAAVTQWFFTQHKRLLIYGIVLAATTVLAGVGLLGLSGWFITATAVAGLSTTTAISFNVFGPSAGIRLLALGRTAARYGERLVTHDGTLAALAGLRGHLFLGWSSAQQARHLTHHPARLLYRLTTDIDALDSVYLRLVVPAASLALVAVFSGVLAGFVLPVAGLLVAGMVLLGSGALAVWQARCSALPVARRSGWSERYRRRIIDAVSGQTELMMADRWPAFLSRLERDEQRLAALDTQVNRADTRGLFLQGALSTAALSTVLLVLAYGITLDMFSIALGTLLVLVVMAAFEPLSGLRRGALDWGRTVISLKRLAPKMQESAPYSAPSPGHAENYSSGTQTIRLSGVSLSYGAGARPVLQSLSLTLSAAERVALVGPSGSGKSSLLMLIAGEIRPTIGAVHAPAATWLTQSVQLFRGTLRDNLLLADPAADDARLGSVLAMAGLDQAVRALPLGLDTVLGERGQGLSEGQARRFVLARLMLRPVPVWLLDEPTESVDTATATDVMHRLMRAAGDRTVVMATHLRREARHADRLIVLQHGSVVQDVRRNEPEFEHVLMSLKPD